MITLAKQTDVKDLVELHLQVFNEQTHYAIHLGELFIRRVMEWYCEPPDQFTFLARKDGLLVGYICLNLGTYNRVFWANRLSAAWGVLRKPSVLSAAPILRRLRGLLSPRPARPASSEGSGYLALIGVSSKAGIPRLGTNLVNAALTEAQSRGWKVVVTATRRDNLAAQGLFMKVGFSRAPEADADNLVVFRMHVINHSPGADKQD